MASLFTYMRHFIHANKLPNPTWFDAMVQHPPPLQPLKGPKPPVIKNADEKYYDAVLKKFPELYLEPFNLRERQVSPPAFSAFLNDLYSDLSRGPHQVTIFVSRWKALMSGGKTESEALEQVEREYLWSQFKLETEKIAAEQQAFEEGVQQCDDDLLAVQAREQQELEERERIEKIPAKYVACFCRVVLICLQSEKVCRSKFMIRTQQKANQRETVCCEMRVDGCRCVKMIKEASQQ